MKIVSTLRQIPSLTPLYWFFQSALGNHFVQSVQRENISFYDYQKITFMKIPSIMLIIICLGSLGTTWNFLGELGELGDQEKFAWGAWGFVQSEILCKPIIFAEFLKMYYVIFPLPVWGFDREIFLGNCLGIWSRNLLGVCLGVTWGRSKNCLCLRI